VVKPAAGVCDGVCRFQVELVDGRSGQQLLDIAVTLVARVSKASDAAVATPGESIYITSDVLDASKLAWLTGTLRQ